MTLRKALLIGCSVLLLAGCGSDDDPKSTVTMAASALKQDDTQTFQSLLIGQAKAQYSNPQAQQDLQAYLNQYRKPSVASETLVKETSVSDTKKFRDYMVRIESKGQHILDVGVKCQLSYATYEPSFESVLRNNASQIALPLDLLASLDDSALRCRPGRDCPGDSNPNPPRDEPRPGGGGGDSGGGVGGGGGWGEPPGGGGGGSWSEPEPRPPRPPRPNPRPDDDDWNNPHYPSCSNYRPGWDNYRPECEPNHPQPPPRPTYSWYQSCRIQSISK